MLRARKGSAGFTLIELLIVVAIIGILAAVAIPAYTGYSQKARLSGVVNSMGAIKTAETAALAQNGAFTACNGVANCGTALGITIDGTYINAFSVAMNGNACVISATLQNLGNIGAGPLTLTNAAGDGVMWTWAGLAAAYLPAS